MEAVVSDWLNMNGSILIAIAMGMHFLVTVGGALAVAIRLGLHPGVWGFLSFVWWFSLERVTVISTIDTCFRGF